MGGGSSRPMNVLTAVNRFIRLTKLVAPRATKSELWRRAASEAIRAASRATLEQLYSEEPAHLDERYHEDAHHTFREAAALYLDEFEGESKKRQAYAIEPLLPYIGDLPCGDVDQDSLKQYIEDRARGEGFFKNRDSAMAGTVNKELGTVRTILNCAQGEWRWIPGVPRIRLIRGGATR